MRKMSLANGIVGLGLGSVLILATAAPLAAGNGCGHPNQPCCPQDMCDPGLLCAEDCSGERDGVGGGAFVCSPTCIPCGGSTQPCCDGGSCNLGLVCDDFFFETQTSTASGGGAIQVQPECVPCGAPGQPCCDADVCDEGAFCETCELEVIAGDGGGATLDCNADTAGGGAQSRGPTQCVACGQPGQPCCPGSMCDVNALCDAGFCEACGQVGEQCCAQATCPNANAVCEEGLCEALPAAPAMGWTAMLSLVGLLVGIGTLRLRRR